MIKFNQDILTKEEILQLLGITEEEALVDLAKRRENAETRAKETLKAQRGIGKGGKHV